MAFLRCSRRSFLERCFVKRPEDRATARELLEHPWITANLAAAPEKMYKTELIGIGMGEAEAMASKQEDAEADEKLREECAAELMCPILQRPMHDALALFPCGDVVSEEAWIGHASKTCPVCNTAVGTTAPNQLVRKLVGKVSAGAPVAPPALGVSSGYFPSPAVSEPTELCQNSKGAGMLSERMDGMSLDTTAY